MRSKFQKTIGYLQDLKKETQSLKEKAASNEQKILLIIKDAILSSEQHFGCIIFIERDSEYTVSHIQRYQYGFDLMGETVNLETVMTFCQKEGINCYLEPDSTGPNQVKLEFDVAIKKPFIKKRTGKKKI